MGWISKHEDDMERHEDGMQRRADNAPANLRPTVGVAEATQAHSGEKKTEVLLRITPVVQEAIKAAVADEIRRVGNSAVEKPLKLSVHPTTQKMIEVAVADEVRRVIHLTHEEILQDQQRLRRDAEKLHKDAASYGDIAALGGRIDGRIVALDNKIAALTKDVRRFEMRDKRRLERGIHELKDKFRSLFGQSFMSRRNKRRKKFGGKAQPPVLSHKSGGTPS